MPHTKARLERISRASSAVRAEIDEEVNRVLDEREQASAESHPGSDGSPGRNVTGNTGQRASQ